MQGEASKRMGNALKRNPSLSNRFALLWGPKVSVVPLNTSITSSTTLVSFLSRRNEITGHPANLLVLKRFVFTQAHVTCHSRQWQSPFLRYNECHHRLLSSSPERSSTVSGLIPIIQEECNYRCFQNDSFSDGNDHYLS